MKLKPIGSNQTELELSDGTTIFFSYSTPVAADHGWHDTMIGSPYYGYSYLSELCTCGE